MGMEISDISSIIEKYGIVGGLFMLAMIILYGAVKTKLFSNIVGNISDWFIEMFMKSKKKEIKHSITESNITNHDIFTYIDFWTYSKVPTFQFSTEYRTVVFRKYLTIYLKTYKKNISEFLNSKEYQEMDEAKIWKALLDLINKIVYDYEKEIEESGISKLVIEKMKSKNNDTISLTIDLIEGVCNSKFYASEKNFLKVYSILNIILSVLENTISNSEGVCDSINGGLKGQTFGGIIEP